MTPEKEEASEASGFILELGTDSKQVTTKPVPATDQKPTSLPSQPALEVLDFGSGEEDDERALVSSTKIDLPLNKRSLTLHQLSMERRRTSFTGSFRTRCCDFHAESQYQLAKALFKSGLYGEAFQRFKNIIHQGSTHRRFQKSVEWLFRLSRVSPEQEPILRELARFRNMRFPQAYRDEYHYLLAKHFFFEARRYEKEEARNGSTLQFDAADAGED